MQDVLEGIRSIIGDWPETEERISHGSPTFWGGKKTFASFHVDHHGDGRVAIWCKADLDLQETLVEADPDTFFVPPYVGPSGWVGIEVANDIDWDMVAALLEDGYRMVAPQRAIKRLDA